MLDRGFARVGKWGAVRCLVAHAMRPNAADFVSSYGTYNHIGSIQCCWSDRKRMGRARAVEIRSASEKDLVLVWSLWCLTVRCDLAG